MIRSFKSKTTEQIYRRQVCRKLPSEVQMVALRKLAQLASAERLNDLQRLPGNRLEALKGDRQGQHSIRLTDQYRLCFVWMDNDACEVDIVDYR